MSIEEQAEIKKQLRLESVIRDAIKGSFGAVAVWILWNAYSQQNENTLKEVDSLKNQVVELTKQVIDCNKQDKQELQKSIYRIEDFIIQNVKK